MSTLSVKTSPGYHLSFAPLIHGVDVCKQNDGDGMLKLIAEDTCRVIVEPIQGEGGLNAPTEEFLRALRRRCDEVGAVLIHDEILVRLFSVCLF